MSEWINVHALWQILVAGLICGAGLPAVFTFGLRALSPSGKGQQIPADGQRLVTTNVAGVALAAVCFTLAVAGVAWGVYFIVSG